MYIKVYSDNGVELATVTAEHVKVGPLKLAPGAYHQIAEVTVSGHVRLNPYTDMTEHEVVSGLHQAMLAEGHATVESHV